jgi:glycosyltransferase involved in cell wall biosynthesis
MANILVLTANLGRAELHKDSGGAERTTTLIEALSDHNVVVLSFGWDTKEFQKQINNKLKHIHIGVDHSTLRNQKQYVDKLPSKNRDLAITRFFPSLKKYRSQLKEILPYADLVVIDHASASPFAADISGVPVVYNSHNCELHMAQQLYPAGSADIDRTRTMEGNALYSATAMTFCSHDDYAKMKELYDIDSLTAKFIPNGGPRSTVTDSLVRHKSKQIMFVGSGHPPNGVAARNIVPIAKELEDYTFVICGDAGWAIKDKLPKNVKVLGRVSDDELDRYFKESFAFINPMESGSGTHLKMMKALGYGIPIITSTVGARGFDDNEIKLSMIVADSTEANVKAVKYLEDQKMFSKLIDGTQEVFDKYDWENVKKDYASFIEEVLQSGAKKKKQDKIVVPKNRKKVLLYSIVRNNADTFDRYYSQVKAIVDGCPDFEFYISIYENDSDDGTKKKIFEKDWSIFSGVSIISENIKTKHFGSVKDATRVENLSNARNKAIEAGGLIDTVDYVLMIEGDNKYDVASVRKLLEFDKLEPDFDVVSAVSLRRNGKHYDWWATRTSAIFNSTRSELEDGWETKQYGAYYSTSNGLCLYRAKPFQEGVRHGWVNDVTKEFDCEMVVLCQNLRKAKYNNIYIRYDSISQH